VPREAKDAIAQSVKDSNSPSKEAGDKTGGMHEEGGIWGYDSSGNLVVCPAKPGQAATSDSDIVSVVPSNVKDSGSRDQITEAGGQWHVHPEGNRTTKFDQPPSTDTAHADTAKAFAPINIVVGAKDKTVYFYDKSGTIAQMPLKDFLK
jgi:hypothetical protein